MLKFRCKSCDQKIGVPEEWAGKKVRCPRCQNAIAVPQLVDAIVTSVPSGPHSVRPATPTPPKPPLMPIPPLKGKTVAVPHPAVKPKTAVKPSAKVASPAVKPVKPPVVKKQAASPARAPAPPPEPQPEPVDRQAAPEPPGVEIRSEPGPSVEPATERREKEPRESLDSTPPLVPDEPSPEPVVVSAKRTSTDSIVTEPPTNKDFSSLFAGGVPSGVGSSDLDAPPQMVEPSRPENRVERTTEPAQPGPPLSAVIDALGGPDEPGTTSSATVSDIVKGLSKETFDEEDRPEPPPSPVVFRSAPLPRTTPHAPVTNTLARSLGTAAMLIGVGALALCLTRQWTRFALPVGTLGLVIALVGAIVPARRRGTEVALATGSAAISLAGIALAILVAAGVVPSAAVARTAVAQARNLPSARVGDVEVKIASAAVVQPVLYADGSKSPKTDPQPVLQVDLQVRNLSGSSGVAYKSWGAKRPDVEPVILRDDEGNELKLIDPAPKVPPGRPREFPTRIDARSKGVSDVLLFEVPPQDARELYLQLPGSNVQLPTPITLQIPAALLRK